MNVPLLKVDHLKKFFKTPKGILHAVDDISFTVGRGQTLGVVGESGCGKSTLGRAILRLIEPTSGQVIYDGQDLLSLSDRKMFEMRRHMQIIFQDPYASLNPRMTVNELIADPIRVNRTMSGSAEINRKVAELMDTVGLAKRLINNYPHELDGGRRQRIGIARALALNPEFIVCDEPVSALDVSIQAQILNLLMDLQEERHLTYIFVTHNMSVVKHISTKIMVMYLGQCVEYCESDELFTNPIHPYTQALLSAIPIPDVSMIGRELTVVRGEVTSPINPRPGCRFAPRCPSATDACVSSDPLLHEATPGHFCACCLK